MMLSKQHILTRLESCQENTTLTDDGKMIVTVWKTLQKELEDREVEEGFGKL